MQDISEESRADGIELAIIGGASVNIAILLHWLAHNPHFIPLRRVRLMDIDAAKLEVVAAYGRRLAEESPFSVEATTDLDEALHGADFVLNHIRVGGSVARRVDEQLCVELGLIYSDPLGVCAFSAALRNIPASVQIARRAAALAPQSWVINYTNPAGAVTEAMVRHSDARVVGMTGGGVIEQRIIARALGLDPARVEVSILGPSHAAWIMQVYVDGAPLDAETLASHVANFLDQVTEGHSPLPPELIKSFGYPLLLSNYFAYYYLPHVVLSKQAAHKDRVRADEVLEIEAEALTQMRSSKGRDLPPALRRRGNVLEQMGLYGPAAYFSGLVFFMRSVWRGHASRLATIVPHDGAVPGLDAQACLQMSCLVDRSGPHPLAVARVPQEIQGLLYSIKAFESLTVRAAMEASPHWALKALLSNPLLASYEHARTVLREVLARQAQYLPQWNT